HLDTDFELHRLSHGPGDAAVSRPTTRRVLVVLSESAREERELCCSQIAEQLRDWGLRRVLSLLTRGWEIPPGPALPACAWRSSRQARVPNSLSSLSADFRVTG